MINIAICDDSDFMRKEVRKHLLNYSIKNNIEFQVEEFEKGERLLEADTVFNLVFMDYQFDNSVSNGISIAKEVIKKGKQTKIIFVSGYSSIVFDCFEVGIFRFLVKPIDEDKFNNAMDGFLDTLKNNDILVTRNSNGSIFIKANTILYLESVGRKTLIHFIDEKVNLECNELLASIEKRMPEYFYRCQKSYIVNMEYVFSYNHAEILMENGDKIPVGRAKYKELMDVHSDYLNSKR